MKHPFKLLISMAVVSSLLGIPHGMAGDTRFKIIATTDVHGSFFPYDFIRLQPVDGSLASVSAYINSQRDSLGDDHIIMLDNGDILQGQPSVYLYNFIDTAVPHLVPRLLRFMRYDAETIGNHDIETGHKVYDRYKVELGDIPLLGANVIDRKSGTPYFQPYTVIERDNVRFAVLGLLTPAIPAWLPENLWAGLEFEDMVESAKKWVPYIMEHEQPDIMIGLFHSGHNSSQKTGKWRENASLTVAEEVPGFDVIFMGHDHQIYLSDKGETPVILNGANNAHHVAEVVIDIKRNDGKMTGKKISGSVVSVDKIGPDTAFMNEFAAEQALITDFVNQQIGFSEGIFSVRDAYFGPSAFMQLLHDLQLEISGADISMAAPLSFDAEIKAGPLRMSDMFTLYKYENMLYTMALTGQEIKDYLELSYNMWTVPMKSPDDHLLRFSEGNAAKGDYAKLKNPSYNFDSAAGIIYEVDVTKERGNKINIISMSDGSPFSLDKTYKVAINSYRGNGGGDLLTNGAGIQAGQLKERILKSTDKDLRYYLIQALKKRGAIRPDVSYNWKFVPDSMVREAISRDRIRLFEH